MKKINMFIINGAMATGKTSLIEEIKKHNITIANSKIHFLDEENFYKFKKEHYEKIKTSEQTDNFNFSVQVFLLNNFMNSFSKIINDFVISDVNEIDIVSDTFPITTGIIFTTFKRQFNLISKDEYNTLINKYDMATKNLFRLLNSRIKINSISLNVFHYYRLIEYNFGLFKIKIRSSDEFDFYNGNLDYYKTLNGFINDYSFSSENIKNIFKPFVDNFEYSLQKINYEEDYDIYNKVILEKLYQV